MGFIKDITRKRTSRALWDQAFGTNKEEGLREKRPAQQSGEGRTALGSKNSIVRLLESYRSGIPGGWSDDRWEQTRHFTGIPYIAIHRTGLQLMQAEFAVSHKDPNHADGKRPVVEGEPEYDLVKLLEKPNGKDSFGTLMYRINQQLNLTGTALAWMVPNGIGDRITELYVIPTALAIPMAVQTPEYPNGAYHIQPVYPYGPFTSFPSPLSAAGAKIPAEWVTQIQYPHALLFYDGYSPLTAMRLPLDVVDSIDRSRWYNMKRGINPSAVLNFDQESGASPLPEPEIERIRSDFENDHMGPENTSRLLVSTPGAKLEQWGSTPDKMMYEQGWDQLTSFNLGAFGITKPAAGMVEGSSYATLFATLKQLHLLTLDPICTLIGQMLTRKLSQFYGDDITIDIRCRRIDDHDVSFAKVDKMTSLKGMPESVIRLAFGMMDIPQEDDVIKDLAKAGEQQGAPGGMPGMAGPAPEPPPLKGVPGEQGQVTDESTSGTDEQDIANGAEGPKKLGQGSLGPRKNLLSNGRNGHTKNGRHEPTLAELFGRVRGKRLPDKFMSAGFSDQPVVNVQVDQPSAPQVNVQIVMPEHPVPTVNNQIQVDIPPPRKITKDITYNSQGWPTAIEEREEAIKES